MLSDLHCVRLTRGKVVLILNTGVNQIIYMKLSMKLLPLLFVPLILLVSGCTGTYQGYQNVEYFYLVINVPEEGSTSRNCYFGLIEIRPEFDSRGVTRDRELLIWDNFKCESLGDIYIKVTNETVTVHCTCYYNNIV